MPFLDTATKVIRLLSAVVWFGVGVLTLWITWRTFQELEPFLSALRETPAQVGGVPGASGNSSLEELLRASSGLRGSR